MTAKYPVELSDAEGIVDAVNYLLSGPAGLGQNFDGFSDYNPAVIRPTFFRPFTLPYTTTLDANWYIRLAATAASPTPSNPTQFITIDFGAGPGYTSPPFQFGDRLKLTDFVCSGVDPDFWNDSYNVYSSTTTSVTLATTGTYTWPAVTSLGYIVRDYSNYPVSTDCLAQATINSTTDRVFITAQVEFTTDTANTGTIPPFPSYYSSNNYDMVVQVNRYTASLNAQGNTVFNFQDTVSQKIFSTFLFDPTYTDGFSAIFTTIIDKQLQYGSYAYILEIAFVTKPKLSDGTTPGLSGFGSTPGWLADYGFKTAALPRGVAVGNLQVQSIPSGTTFTGIVPTILTGSGSNPLLDVTVYPDLLRPLYVVGVSGGIPDGTVEITLNSTSGTENLNFQPGDQLKILGTDIGGASPLNDLYFTVTETDLRSLVVPGSFTMGLRNLTTQVIKE